MKKRLIDYQYMIQALEDYAPDNFLFRFRDWEMIYWKFSYAFVGLALYECETFDREKLARLPLPTEYHYLDTSDFDDGPYEENNEDRPKFLSKNLLFENWNTKAHQWIHLLDNVYYIDDVYDFMKESEGFREHLKEELYGIWLMNCGLSAETLADVMKITEEEAEQLLSDTECSGDWIYEKEGICVFDYSGMEKLRKKISVKENKTPEERAFMISYDKTLHSEFIQYMAIYSGFYSDGEESKKYYSLLITCEPLEVNRIESFDAFHIIHYMVCKERYDALMAKGDEICEGQCQISA